MPPFLPKSTFRIPLTAALLLWATATGCGPTATPPPSRLKPAIGEPATSPVVSRTEPVVIDLLDRIEPARDQVRGTFQRSNSTLLIPAGEATQLELPVTPPRRYRLEIDAERLSGKDSLNIGLVVNGHQVMLVLDGWQRQFSGLNRVDGRTGDNNPTTWRQPIFRGSEMSRIVCTVGPDRVQVASNGTTIIDWKGAPERLSLDQRFWKVRTPGRLTLGAWNTSFRISRLTLTDLTPLDLASRPTNPNATENVAPRDGVSAAAPVVPTSPVPMPDTAMGADRVATSDRAVPAGNVPPRPAGDATSPTSPAESATEHTPKTGTEPRRRDATNKAASSEPGDSPAVAWAAAPDPLVPPLNYTAEKISLELADESWVLLPDGPSNFFVVAASEAANWQFRVFDLRSGTFVGQPVSVERRGFSQFRFSPSGRYLAGYPTAGQDTELVVWSFVDGERVGQFPTGVRAGEERWTWLGGEHRLASLRAAGNRAELTVWDLRTGDRLHALSLDHPLDRLRCAGTSPAGKFLALTWHKQLDLVDLSTGTLAGQVPLPGNSVGGRALAFSPDGSELAIITINNEKRVTQLWCLDMRTGATLLVADHAESLSSHETNYKHGPLLDWFPDKRTLLFGGRDVIDRLTGKVVSQLPTNIYWMEPKRILSWDHKLDMLPTSSGSGRLYQSFKFDRNDLDKALTTVAAGGEAVDTRLPPLTAVELSRAERIVLPGDDVAWSLTADPRPAAAGEFRQRIVLGRFGATGERPQDRLDGVDVRRLLFSSPASAVAVAHQELRSDYHRQRRQVLTRHELRSGRTTVSLPIPDDYRLIDASPSGNLALTGLANEVGGYPRLDVIQLTAKQHLAGWRPYTSEPWVEDPHPTGQPVPRNPQTVRWAWFLDEQLVVTVNPAGKLICWQMPECRAVYVCEEFGEPLAQSAGRRYVVGFQNSALHILDAATGRWAGRLPLPESPDQVPRAAFRSDGRELAAIVRRPSARVMHVVRWDLADGKRGDEFPIAFNLVSPVWNDYKRPDHAQTGLEYRGDRYLLLDDRPLLDLTNRAAVWQYSIRLGGFAVGSPDDRSWYFCRQETQAAQGQLFEIVLTAAETPDAVVRQRTANIQRNDQGALAPGQSGSLPRSILHVDGVEPQP